MMEGAHESGQSASALVEQTFLPLHEASDECAERKADYLHTIGSGEHCARYALLQPIAV